MTPAVQSRVPFDKVEVLYQLDKMLAHCTFKRSERCSGLLSYLVHQALENPDVQFKERTLGANVFGRPVDYDTADDPIVRVTISDIKKRIGLYYHEHGHESELRIELMPGSYTPKFLLASSPKPEILEDAELGHLQAPGSPELDTLQPAHSLPDVVMAAARRSFPRHTWNAVLVVLVLGLISLVAAPPIRAKIAPSTEFDKFWTPFVSSKPRVLICTARLHAQPGQLVQDDSNQNPALADLSSVPVLPWADTRALMKVLSRLHRKQQFFVFRDSEDITFKDLRDGPAILIGGFTNTWSNMLSAPLQYHIETDPASHTATIRDAKDPGKNIWRVDLGQDYETAGTDYALVSNYRDPTTGTRVLQLAGLGPHGAEAAGEFVDSPKYLNQLQSRMSGCDNLQIVIKVQIMGGANSTPAVDGVHCW